jgi:cytochrome c oxidase assembly protein subunit 17
MGFLDSIFGKKEEPAKKTPQLGKFSGKKICCSCPDTKELRDVCVVAKGEAACSDLIEAHKACLREEGFTVK